MIRRLGCLVVLALLLYVAWTKWDTVRPWLPTISWGAGHRGAASAGASDADTSWSPLTAHGAARADQAVARLGTQPATTFVTVRPGDFAGYVLLDVAGKLPPATDSAVAQAGMGAFRLRTSLDLKNLGGPKAFGPLGSVLGDRERLEVGGTFDVVRRGVAEFRITEVRLHGIPVPGPLIPTIVHKMENGPHPTGVADNALLLNVPPYVADIRVTGGQVAVYKNSP